MPFLQNSVKTFLVFTYRYRPGKRNFIIIKSVLLLCVILSTNVFAQGPWVPINPNFYPPGDYFIYDGSFTDKNHGWFLDVGTRRIFFSNDGGLNWYLQKDSIKSPMNSPVNWDIIFVDSLNGWVLPGNADSTTLLKTVDGGINWTEIKIPGIFKMYFKDKNNGIGGGSKGIYKTQNGGLTWEKVSPMVILDVENVYSIFFLNEQKGWMIVQRYEWEGQSVVIRTTDGGNHWEHMQAFLPTSHSHGIFFMDTLNVLTWGIVTGVWKSSNGGNTWEQKGEGANNILFIDENNAWAVGGEIGIGYTNNAGETWQKIDSINAFSKDISFFIEEETGFIFGIDNIYKYDKTVDIIENKKTTPSQLELYQNYPNPFNPLTTIMFTIPKSGYIQLSLYDLLGRKIEVIKEGTVDVGKYTITLDAGGLPSGPYFIKLTKGLYTKAIKVILLK